MKKWAVAQMCGSPKFLATQNTSNYFLGIDLQQQEQYGIIYT